MIGPKKYYIIFKSPRPSPSLLSTNGAELGQAQFSSQLVTGLVRKLAGLLAYITSMLAYLLICLLAHSPIFFIAYVLLCYANMDIAPCLLICLLSNLFTCSLSHFLTCYYACLNDCCLLDCFVPYLVICLYVLLAFSLI